MSDLSLYIEQTVVKTCRVCGKRFIPTHEWAYKNNHEFYCRYSCYRQAGGDSGGKDRRYTRENVYNSKKRVSKKGVI